MSIFLTLYEVRRGIGVLRPAVVWVLLGPVQDVQRRLHGAYQLVPAVPPGGPLLRVPGQTRLQLVHPERHSRDPPCEDAAPCDITNRPGSPTHLCSVNASKGMTSYSLDSFMPELTSAWFSWVRKNSCADMT